MQTLVKPEINEWHPQPKQELFMRLPWDEVLFGGAKGPGKTDALLSEGTRQIDHLRYRGVIFRRTVPQLDEIVIRSHERFSSWAKWNEQKHVWTWPSGARLKLAHCQREQDKYNYQGHEYHYMGFDQLETFTLTMYLFLIAQCRTSDPTLRCYIRSTANPTGVGHAWVKERFIDKLDRIGTPKWFKRVNDEDTECPRTDTDAMSRAFVFATVFDNPALMDNDPAYLSRLRQLSEKMRRALMDGDWDVLEGQFFHEWRRQIHVITMDELNALCEYLPFKIVMGLDYGYNKPSSVGWYKLFPDGNLVRYRELYVERHTYEELIRRALALSVDQKGRPEKIEYMAADPAVWGDKRHHNEPKDGESRGESGAEVMQEIVGSRFPILKADNRRIVGWGRLRQYLRPYTDQHGQIRAHFLVTENCRNFIRTIPGLVFDETRPEDLDTDGEDHPQDEARYVIMSRPEIPVKPPEPKTRGEEFWDRVHRDVCNIQMEGKEDTQEREMMEDGARPVGE